MNLHEISIVDLNLKKINYIFFKANRYIIEKYRSEFEGHDIFYNMKKLEEIWLKEFNARLDSCISSKYSPWSKIQFDSRVDKTMFILRWG
jgi:hypothetical protein